MDNKKSTMVRIDQPIYDEVAVVTDANKPESRNITHMTNVLLREALDARKAKKKVKVKVDA